jgi:CheY-like chemotaxis protein
VADDEPDLVGLISRRLCKAGYRVITAADGREALELAQSELPAAAVLDIMMPFMTGIEVSRRLRSIPATRHIKVILVSAGQPDRPVVPADADAFISKPFGPTEIPLAVNAVLARPTRGAHDAFANASAASDAE